MKEKIKYFEFTVGEKIPQEVIEGKMKVNNRLAIRGVLFYQNKLLMIFIVNILSYFLLFVKRFFNYFQIISAADAFLSILGAFGTKKEAQSMPLFYNLPKMQRIITHKH